MTRSRTMWRLFRSFALALSIAGALCAPAVAQTADAASSDGVANLVARLEQILVEGNPSAYLNLVAPLGDQIQARAFAEDAVWPGVTRAIVRERDRIPLPGAPPGQGYRLMVESFVERGARGRVATWKLDVRLLAGGPSAPAAGQWYIASQQRLTTIEDLYALSLDSGRQYAVSNLEIADEDLTLKMATGSAFLASTDDGPTAVVLLGRGEMTFTPAPAAERVQIRIFAGAETLRTTFDAAFVRINADEFETRFKASSLTRRSIDAKQLGAATDLFKENITKSFSVDLSDLSGDNWSFSPPPGDFLAEIRTRRFDTLTYSRTGGEAEDVSVFDRKKKRNIAVYASAERLARRGPFYSEDDLVDYDVLDYNLDVSFDPAREWIQGRARVRLKVRSFAIEALTLRLNDSLSVQSVTTERFGRLMYLRARGQNSLIMTLPLVLPKDTELVIAIAYAGRVESQSIENEAVALQPEPRASLDSDGAGTVPRYLYSNRSYWYPQATVPDYALARIRIAVPSDFSVVASGEVISGGAIAFDNTEKLALPGQRQFTFVALQPLRYLACVIGKFNQLDTQTVATSGTAPDELNGGSENALHRYGTGVFYNGLELSVEAGPGALSKRSSVPQVAAEIVRFYSELTGDTPYPAFTLAVTEADLPGGHSPAYFAVLNEFSSAGPTVWRDDPVNFQGYQHFVLAHEIAHQWWGQAVGWKNYHEQWLSEGFAQYFALLYAQQSGQDVFARMLRQMRRSAADYSDQGPLYLGYRLGHIKGDRRVFRALVYNKGAMVLHMLRRLVGDTAFFRGMRHFYGEWRFRKAGSDDLRRTFEAETSIPLKQFFEQWIHGFSLPRLKFRYATETTDVVLRFEQTGDIFPVPVTVTLNYATGRSVSVVVPVVDRVTVHRVPVAGRLRSVDVNRDNAALAEIDRN